jgi:hypothetical protein
MAHWLNANAAGIQALGSVATVLLTAVLAWITWRYAKLTERLVSAQLGEAAARRRELRTQAEVISTFLRDLPSQDDPRLSVAILSYFNDLRDFSSNRFRALASEVIVEAGRQAAAVEEHGTWLINLVRDIRAAPRPTPRGVNEPLGTETKGYDWSTFPRKDYDTRLRSAVDALQRLLAEVDSRERGLSDAEAG